jgi:hypothetical protein
MKKLLAVAGMVLVNSGFALDEYLSIEKGKVEVDAGYAFTKPTGSFDPDGKSQDLDKNADGPIGNGIPLQVKYGIIDGLDAELAISGIMNNKDFGDQAGFSQPELAVKYSVANIGVGGFVNAILPFATGNLDNPEPAFGLGLGAVYQNRFGDFRITGQAGYQLNFENKDKLKNGNVLLAYAKPEAMWTEYIGTYLGLKYMMQGEPEVDGKSMKDLLGPGTPDLDAYQFAVLPGINVQLTQSLAYEVNVPVYILGKNAQQGFGINANLYATLPFVK